MNRGNDKLAARSHRRWKQLLFLALFAGGVYILVAGESGYLQVEARRTELQLLRNEVNALRAQNDSLRTQLELLRSDIGYLEKVAREEYGMKKPGEEVYRIPEETGKAE
jgi:cell division protein FtsB